MNHFDLIDGVLHAENVPLPDIAEAVGTPVYVYSRATFERHAVVFRAALSGLDNPHLAFAVKSNPNLAVLKVLARQGYGADVVSGGEMDRALAAGMAAEDIVFSGVGKTAEEMTRALKIGVGQFNIESEEEGQELAALAAALGLTFVPALEKVLDTAEQKVMANSSQQARNLDGSLVVREPIPTGPCLLIDDMVDSRWTFTVAAWLLRQHGSGPVFPLALAQTGQSD